MDPKEFNDLAAELAANNTPAKARTAISRAYYAAYLIGYELLTKELGIPIKQNSEGHKYVKRFLNNCGDREFAELSTRLGTLQRDRLQADYYPENEKVEEFTKAKSSVEHAEYIINAIRTNIEEPRRLRIIENIQNYRKTIF